MHTSTLHSHRDRASSSSELGRLATTQRAARPPSAIDRVALHLGMALIIWGRRSYHAGPSREELALRHENLVARQRREDHSLRRHLLIVVER